MAEISKNCLSIFEYLEKELHLAVCLDEVYKLQNEAKFRAVHQNVESYEEFKEIVNAAHLQPLKKDEFQELRKPKSVVWNCMTSSQTTEESGKDLVKNEDSQISLIIPPTYQEFLKTWQKDRLADEHKFLLLKSAKADWLTRILTMEISLGNTGKVLKALWHFEDNCEDVEFVVGVLVTMSAMPLFDLSMEFLVEEEKEVCKQLFDLLQKSKSSRIDFQDLKNKFVNL